MGERIAKSLPREDEISTAFGGSFILSFAGECLMHAERTIPRPEGRAVDQGDSRFLRETTAQKTTPPEEASPRSASKARRSPQSRR